MKRDPAAYAEVADDVLTETTKVLDSITDPSRVARSLENLWWKHGFNVAFEVATKYVRQRPELHLVVGSFAVPGVGIAVSVSAPTDES